MNLNIPNITTYSYNERGKLVSRITKNGYDIIESVHKSYNENNKIEIEILQNISNITNIEYKYLNDGTESYEKIINKICKNTGLVETVVETTKYTPEGDWLFIYDGSRLKHAIQYKDNERNIILNEIYYGLYNEDDNNSSVNLYLYRYIYNDKNQIVKIYENEKEIINVSYNENDKVNKVIIYKNPVIKRGYDILKTLTGISIVRFTSKTDHIIHEIDYLEDKKINHIVTVINKNNRELYKRIDEYNYKYNQSTNETITMIERSSDAGANIGRFMECKIQIIEEAGCITKYTDDKIVSKEIFDDKNNLIRYEDYHIEY